MAVPADPNNAQSFSSAVGLLYVFNLIVGTGALALPKAFQTAGYALGIIILLISAFTSYICATFIVECMAIANAMFCLENRIKSADDDDENDVSEPRSSSNFQIVRRVEVSEMSRMFLGKLGLIFTMIVLTLYLFGDLAIYSTTVPKSLMNVICSSFNASTTNFNTPCHENWPKFFTRFNVYRICVVAFISFCLPMVLIGMTKTKHLQLATTLSRWLAFILMIIIASIQLIETGPQASPPPANIGGFGSLFGVAVYAFMCHHSIPGLITPMRNKDFVNFKLISVYVLVFAFYTMLSTTGSFAFSKVQDVYTLNFLHDDKTSFVYTIMDYFLALFPVFTLTSSYIIVAITLSNNVRALITMVQGTASKNRTEETPESEQLLNSTDDEIDSIPLRHSTPPEERYSLMPIFTKYGIPILVIFLPTLISFFNDNVLLLASLTGSYPGVGVQFIIPSLLTIGARRYAKNTLRQPIPESQASPFRSQIWPYITIGWAIIAILNVTANLLHMALFFVIRSEFLEKHFGFKSQLIGRTNLCKSNTRFNHGRLYANNSFRFSSRFSFAKYMGIP